MSPITFVPTQLILTIWSEAPSKMMGSLVWSKIKSKAKKICSQMYNCKKKMSACKTCKTLRLLGNMNVRDLLLTNLLGSDHFPTCQLPVMPALNCCFSCCVLWRECNIEPVSRLSNWSIFVGRKGWAQIEIIWRHLIFKHTQAFLTSNEVRYGHDITTTTVLFVSSAINRMRFGADFAWIIQTQTPFPPISPRHQQATQNHLSWDPKKKSHQKKLILPFPYAVWMVQKSNFTQPRYMKANRQQLGDSHYFLVNSGVVEPSTVWLWDVTKVIS